MYIAYNHMQNFSYIFLFKQVSGMRDPKSVESLFPEHSLWITHATVMIYMFLSGDAGAIFLCTMVSKHSGLLVWRSQNTVVSFYGVIFVLGQANLR